MKPQYICLPSESYAYDGYSVVSLRPEDIYAVMEWRNAQLDLLRQQTPLTRADQLHYFKSTIEPTYSQKQPELILLSILHNNELIGYGGLVHINWQAQRAEVSFLTPPSRANDHLLFATDFTAFLHLIKEIAFNGLHLHRLTTETFAIRPRVIDILQNNGFRREGLLRGHNLIGGEFVDSIVQGCLNDQLHRQLPLHSPKNSTTTPCNILITSISQKIPLLQQLRKAICEVMPEAVLFGGDADEHCLGKHFVDHFWKMPSAKDLSVAEIIFFCEQNNIGIVFPTRDGELQFFADSATQLQHHGIEVMVSPSKAVRTCLDKYLFSSFFESIEPVNVVPSSLSVTKTFGNSLVVKERFGSGSAGTRTQLTPHEATLYAKKLTAPLFQPHIQGREYSIDVYIPQSDSTRRAVARSRDTVIDGESKISTIRDMPLLRNICCTAAHHLGLVGHAVFQAIVDENTIPHIIECNCRVGGASTLSMEAGLLSFQWFMRECKGMSLPGATPDASTFGMRLIRTPCDTFHYEYDQLRS